MSPLEKRWVEKLKADRKEIAERAIEALAALEKIRDIAWATACPKGHVYDDCHCRSDEAGRIADAVIKKEKKR